MTITVVIPTWNAAAFIAETLASVRGQTVPPDELIVVDDCSTDATAAMVEAEFKMLAFPARLVKLPVNSGGPAKPMNAGVEAALGDWIVTLDHDDELLPGRIEQLKANAGRFGDCGVVIGRMTVRPDDDRGHLLDKAWASVESLANAASIVDAVTAYAGLAEFGCYAMSCSAMAFPKSMWTSIGGFDETVRTCIDFAFLEAVLRTQPLGVMKEPVARWRHLPTNLSHDFRRRVADVSAVMQRIHDRYQTLPSRLVPKLRSDLLARADMLAAQKHQPAAWHAWHQARRQYGVRLSSLQAAAKLLLRRVL